MIRRCHNSDHTAFRNYGARGITVCAEWRDYRNFKAWADASGYTQGLTIDRMDNDHGYSPENCRWATRKQQQNNRRCCVYVEHDGQRLTLTQWSELLGVSRKTVRRRFEAMHVGK
jgi:AraC-like DNA-binding protein